MSTEKKKKIQAEGIGSRLRGLREKEKMSVRAFGEQYGFSYSLWSDYENDRRKPNATTIERLCQTFGVSADWIIRGDPAQKLSDAPASQQTKEMHDVTRIIKRIGAGAVSKDAPPRSTGKIAQRGEKHFPSGRTPGHQGRKTRQK